MLTPSDERWLKTQGIPPSEARRQWRALHSPPPFLRLLRPCRLGDGIYRLTPEEFRRRSQRAHARSSHQRLSSFIPASGAASRLFQSLRAFRALTNDEQKIILRRGTSRTNAQDEIRLFFRRFSSFPFAGEVERLLASRRINAERLIRAGQYGQILDALFDPPLAYDRYPKGLIPFHIDGRRVRTAFEEHLRTIAGQGADDRHPARAHVTVSPEHRALFRRELRKILPTLPGAVRVRFSDQSPRTRTLAVDARGHLLRDVAGRPVLRPGGHGSLLMNLSGCGGDLVFVRNIDNIPVADRQKPGLDWRRVILSLLLELQTEAYAVVRGLERDPTSPELHRRAVALLVRFGRTPRLPSTSTTRGRRLAELLNRPIRVCGMVPNIGDPGGGPFWVHGPEGPTIQIVESAQVDVRDRTQWRIFSQATHFNPVDMVLGLRDHRGRLYELRRFADPRQVFLVDKSQGGCSLRGLEHPGLWNGGMAHWNTLFVETDRRTFHPVKTIADLLRPGHRST